MQFLEAPAAPSPNEPGGTTWRKAYEDGFGSRRNSTFLRGFPLQKKKHLFYRRHIVLRGLIV